MVWWHQVPYFHGVYLPVWPTSCFPECLSTPISSSGRQHQFANRHMTVINMINTTGTTIKYSTVEVIEGPFSIPACNCSMTCSNPRKVWVELDAAIWFLLNAPSPRTSWLSFDKAAISRSENTISTCSPIDKESWKERKHTLKFWIFTSLYKIILIDMYKMTTWSWCVHWLILILSFLHGSHYVTSHLLIKQVMYFLKCQMLSRKWN